MPEIETDEQAEKQRHDTVNGGRAAALRPYQFKPGQSGNPGGRPKGRSLRTIFVERLEAEVKGGKIPGRTVIEAIVDALVRMARKGDLKAIQEVLNRYGGKVTDVIRHEGVETLVQPDRQARLLNDPAALELACDLDERLIDDGGA